MFKPKSIFQVCNACSSSNRKCVYTSPRCCCIFAHLHTSSHHRIRRFLSASNTDWGKRYKRYKRYDLLEYTYLSFAVLRPSLTL